MPKTKIMRGGRLVGSRPCWDCRLVKLHDQDGSIVNFVNHTYEDTCVYRRVNRRESRWS